MKGDFSRRTYDPRKHYSGVLDQQGRVRLDADLNELVDIVGHRVETEAIDVIGGCGAPVHDAGFAITTDGTTLTIGKGRCYVDGIMCENETDLAYGSQPDLPSPPDLMTALGGGSGILYLDVWQRHITALDDARLREVALGGPDSTTRIKTVWQVRVLPVANSGGSTGGAVPECSGSYPEWDALVAEPTGTLNARTRPADATDDPCLLPPGAGYQRLENQLYRVEIHAPGPVGTATFKWSRDNGSVVTPIEQVSGQTVTVHDTGPDEVLGFANGNWVELLDDTADLNGVPGVLLQITNVDAATRVITLSGAAPALDLTRHPKLRRWDSAGALAVTNTGANGGWLPIEAGVEVLFGDGTYLTGDYWLIPARTATAEIEWPPFAVPNVAPIKQPREGIEHHYCRLAMVQVTAGKLTVVKDCRAQFPPLTEIGTATTPPAIHVTGTSWKNDDIVAVSDLIKGLQINLSAAPWGRGVAAKAPSMSLDPAALTITLEIPLTAQAFGAGVLGLGNASLSLELAGSNQISGTQSSASIMWIPDAQRQLLARLEELLKLQTSLRVRVRLSGHVVWGDVATGSVYLDGRALGQPGARLDGSPRTALRFPSGVGDQGSDFESWFYLGEPPHAPPPLQVKTVAFLTGKGVRRTVLSPPGVVSANSPLASSAMPYEMNQVSGIEMTFTRAASGASVNEQSVWLEKVRGGSVPGTVKLSSDGVTVQFVVKPPARQPVYLSAADYRLHMVGTTSSKISAIQALGDNSDLDGDFNGQPGGDFVFPFSVLPTIG